MFRFVSFAFVFSLISMPVQAYIGPGLAVPLVWVMFGPIAAVAIVVALVAYFPLRYFYKKRKKEKMFQAQENPNATPGDEIEGAE